MRWPECRGVGGRRDPPEAQIVDRLERRVGSQVHPGAVQQHHPGTFQRKAEPCHNRRPEVGHRHRRQRPRHRVDQLQVPDDPSVRHDRLGPLCAHRTIMRHAPRGLRDGPGLAGASAGEAVADAGRFSLVREPAAQRRRLTAPGRGQGYVRVTSAQVRDVSPGGLVFSESGIRLSPRRTASSSRLIRPGPPPVISAPQPGGSASRLSLARSSDGPVVANARTSGACAAAAGQRRDSGLPCRGDGRGRVGAGCRGADRGRCSSGRR